MLSAVHVPTSVEEALDRLGDGATALGGGTVLMPVLTTAASPATALVSLRRAGLAGVRLQGDAVEVGAATTLSALAADERLAFLAPAIATIASPPVRNLATVGGNLFAPAPHGDLATCLLALDAEVDVRGPAGDRTVAVGDVVVHGIGAGELVTALRFAPPADGTWRYRKAMRRRHSSAAIVTVAAVVEIDGDTVASARIALGGVGPRPFRSPGAETAIVGRHLDAEAVAEAATAAVAEAEPFDDAYASAWYRTRVLPVHLRRALLDQ